MYIKTQFAKNVTIDKLSSVGIIWLHQNSATFDHNSPWDFAILCKNIVGKVLGQSDAFNPCRIEVCRVNLYGKIMTL